MVRLLVGRSAGLCSPGQYNHLSFLVSSWMNAILLPVKTSMLALGSLILASVTLESLRKVVWVIFRCAFVSFLICRARRTPNSAASSSDFGGVSFLEPAIFIPAASRLQFILSLFCMRI